MKLLEESTLTRIREMTGPGEEDFLDLLIGEFEKIAMDCAQQIHSSAEVHDRRAYQRWVHKLKGSAHNIGAARVYALCEQFELDPRLEFLLIENAVRETLLCLRQQWKKSR